MKRSQACRITAHSQLKTAWGSFKSPTKTATPPQVLPKLILLQNQVETSMSLKITGNHFETGSSDAKRRAWLAVEAELVAGMGLDLTGAWAGWEGSPGRPALTAHAGQAAHTHPAGDS